MKALFVDTAGWMAMADAGDPAHRACRASRDRWLRSGGMLISSDYVMDESLTLIRLRLGLRATRSWWDQMAASGRLQWEWIGPERVDKARDWFFRWSDKECSFTDCTSFVVMRELRLRSALTTDAHFRQAGFQTVPSA